VPQREGDMRTPVLDSTGVSDMTHSPPNMDNFLHRSIANRTIFIERDRRRMAEAPKLGCKCKKTKCLKLYCRCFSLKQTCHDSCTCIRSQCKNTTSHDQSRLNAIQTIRSRDSFAFDSKLRRGCRCVNSNCLKKYCICFRAGAACSSDLCQCLNCKNEKDEGRQFFPKAIIQTSNAKAVTTNKTSSASSSPTSASDTSQKRSAPTEQFFDPSFFEKTKRARKSGGESAKR